MGSIHRVTKVGQILSGSRTAEGTQFYWDWREHHAPKIRGDARGCTCIECQHANSFLNKRLADIHRRNSASLPEAECGGYGLAA